MIIPVKKRIQGGFFVFFEVELEGWLYEPNLRRMNNDYSGKETNSDF
ncbi:hypothetical protein [Paenibacillus sp. IHB B 3415]|nr:hypothetical protein [Paenibacillus sp. IHB B 3415]